MTDFYTSVSRIGSYVYYSGYENGEKVLRKYKFSPSLYVKTNKRDSPYESIYGEPLQRIDFESLTQASDFVKEADGTNMEVFGNTNFVFQYIVDKFPDEINGIDSSSMNVCIFDLEVSSEQGFPHPDKAEYPIISGAFYFSKTDEYVVFGLKDGYEPSSVSNKPVRFVWCKDEATMLSRMMALLNVHSPDILTGWNVRLFDVPYLIHRIDGILGEGQSNKLSPWNRISKRSIVIKGKENVAYDIVGVSQLDYLDIFKKFSTLTYGQLENYRLDTVAEIVVGENKLDYSEYANLHELYVKDYQRFLDYNLRDVLLVNKIDQQVRYIDIAVMLAFKSGVNFVDTLGTVNAWDTYIYRELLKRNQIISPKRQTKRESYEGAFVKEPVPGMYEWVVSFDLASLYPNIIIQYNMSPETFVHDDRQSLSNGVRDILENRVRNEKPDLYAMTANGAYFRKDRQGIIAELAERVYGERVQIKDYMLECERLLQKETDEARVTELKKRIDISKNAQTAIKIFLNSLYGCLGTPFFRWFNVTVAEAITLSAQVASKYAEKKVNDYLNGLWKTERDWVITMDTDSLYIDLSRFIESFNPSSPVDFLNRVCKDSIEPVIRAGYDELFEIMGGYKSRLQMKREKIANRGFFTGKKRYCLSVLDNEGVRYKEPKIVIVGIEAIKSSTPKIIRQRLKDSFRIILENTEDEVKAFIDETKDMFMRSTPEQVAFPRSVSDVEKYQDRKTLYKKGVPINSRAAILYNHHVDRLKLNRKYMKINSGDKMLWIYLKVPNPIRENVIGFVDKLPEEFNLHDYIDYNLQFNKTFLSVLGPIFEKIGWNAGSDTDLNDFFF